MMRLKTLIVDDEPVARKVLREELESIPDIEVIGEADNGATALEKIARQRPDLVLLDLQMPAPGGLEVVRNLKRGPHMPAIVMVTAYDQYALQAFEAGAIDYLLKPVSQERLTEADLDFHRGEYERLRAKLEAEFAASTLPESPRGKEALNDLLVRVRLRFKE